MQRIQDSIGSIEDKQPYVIKYIFLPELLAWERKNLDKERLSVTQRLQLCIKALEAMEKIIKTQSQVDCLGLHGFITKSDDKNNFTEVIIGSHTYPTTSLDSLKKLIIGTTDSSKPANNQIDNEKKSIQLLGFLFIEIFRILWSVNKNESLTQKMNLICQSKLPASYCFQPGFYNQYNKTTIDDTSKNTLSALMISMCQIDPAKRPSISEALTTFYQVYHHLQFIQKTDKSELPSHPASNNARLFSSAPSHPDQQHPASSASSEAAAAASMP